MVVEKRGGTIVKDIRNRIAGALYGVAIGDALGAPLEFMSKKEITRKHGRVTEMIGGGWLNVVPGEITDDTQMTLAVAEGIIEGPDNPIQAIGKRFIEWARSGPKDIGGTCSMSIRWAAFLGQNNEPDEEKWFEASKYTSEANGGRSGGNGALMRTVYPGLYYKELLMAVETAGAIAQMTHWDKKSTEACNLYTEMIHLITESISREEALQIIRDVLKDSEYSLKARKKLKPTGYVVDSFNCALHSIAATVTFEDAIIEAANLGGDADTIAAIAGGLAGVIYGYNEIPVRWIQTLDPGIRKQLDKLVDAAVKNREDR
jgi:ADP-ribosyl-[dinitrogen reductase] hydrolase